MGEVDKILGRHCTFLTRDGPSLHEVQQCILPGCSLPGHIIFCACTR